MRHPIAPQDLGKSQPKNADVETKGLPPEILKIQFDFFGNRQFIPAINLRPSGQSRDQFMNTLRRTQLDQIVLIEQCRPRTNKTHITGDYAPKLR